MSKTIVLFCVVLAGCIADANRLELEPDLRTPDASPDTAPAAEAAEATATRGVLEARPQALVFGRVSPGEWASRFVELRNVGAAPVHVTHLEVLGDRRFAILWQDRDVRALSPDEYPGASGFEPGESVRLAIAFRTDDPSYASARLVIGTDSGPDVTVTLDANRDVECLELDPPLLEWPSTVLGRSDQRAVQIRNCGAMPIAIHDYGLDDTPDDAPDGEAFFIADESPPTPLFVAPGEGPRALIISFDPLVAGLHRGTLRLETDMEASPTVSVPLMGIGDGGECPRAVVAGAEDQQVRVLPHDIVLLDGSPSARVNRTPIVEFRWLIVRRPAGSLSQLLEEFSDSTSPASGGPADDPATPGATLWIDMAGTWVLELEVVNQLGRSSSECDANAQFTIDANR